MSLVIFVGLILWQLNGFVSAYCLYGNSSDCVFECHCAVDSECDGGRCPSGCDTAPLGYNWTGPACQIGNVGLHKTGNMTPHDFYQHRYPASAALDGVSPGKINSKCAHPTNLENKPAEWWADLGDLYKIYNITIYGRTDCCDWRLEQFDLTVYNTSDNKVLCAHHNDSIKTYSTITCTRPVIGRYVHFKRTGGRDIGHVALCEVVIIGHKYIDCSLCPRDVDCNDVIGCEKCDGSYQPDCKQTCQAGYYGVNCKKQCGHCKHNITACDSSSGRCLSGCELWWTDTTCHTYIDQPNQSNETVTLIVKSSVSIQIKWQPIDGIPSNLSDFYGYLIQYKVGTTDDDYTKAGIVKHDSDPSWTFEDLKSDREYFIQIKPFREYEGKKEFGTAYNTLQVKTESVDADANTIILILLNVLFAAVIILLGVLLWKSRIALAKERQKKYEDTVQITEIQREASKPVSTRLDSNERTSCEHHSAVNAVYATVRKDRFVNKQEGPQERNNSLAEYEDVTPNVRSKEQNISQYEGLSTETGGFYENRVVEGPYTELHK